MPYKKIMTANNLKKDLIRIGQILVIPEKSQKISTQGYSVKRVERKSSEPYVLESLGRAPLNPGLNSWKNWLKYDFSQLERIHRPWFQKGEGRRLKERLMRGEGKLVYVKKEVDEAGKPVIQYPSLTFRGYKVIENVAPGWKHLEPAIEIVLEDGTRYHFLLACGNTGPHIFVKPPPPPPALPPELPPFIPPTSPPEEITVPEPITPEEALRRMNWELFVYAGAQTDFGGNNARFAGVEGAFYPWIIQHKNSETQLGIGGKANFWWGENFEGFKYDGGYGVVGPAAKYVNYEGWDVSAKVLAGKMWQNGESATGEYESERDFEIVGTSVGYNNYQRELRGEKYFTETQIYGAIFFPLSKDVKHSWQGQGIADTNDLEKFNYVVTIGGKVFLFNLPGDVLRLYIGMGYFREDPTSHSLSFRIGVSDVHKIFFAGIGPNISLDHGDWALAGDIGVDIMRAVEYQRAKHRRAEMIKSIQNAPGVSSFDANTGALVLE
jgi:LysM repeat protein